MANDIARAADAKRGSPFLNTSQAAFYIGLSVRTMEKMRAEGDGPRYRRHARFIRYHIDDLDLWSKSTSGHSTSTGPTAVAS